MKNASANLAIVRRLVLNLLCLDNDRKSGIHTWHILAASSDSYRETLLGPHWFDAIALPLLPEAGGFGLLKC